MDYDDDAEDNNEDDDDEDEEERLLRTQSFLQQTAHLLFEILQHEAATLIVSSAYALVRVLTQSIASAALLHHTSALEAWQCFVDDLWRRCAAELWSTVLGKDTTNAATNTTANTVGVVHVAKNLEGLTAQNAWQLATCLALAPSHATSSSSLSSSSTSADLTTTTRATPAPLLYTLRLFAERYTTPMLHLLSHLHTTRQRHIDKVLTAIDQRVQILPQLASQDQVRSSVLRLVVSYLQCLYSPVLTTHPRSLSSIAAKDVAASNVDQKTAATGRSAWEVDLSGYVHALFQPHQPGATEGPLQMLSDTDLQSLVHLLVSFLAPLHTTSSSSTFSSTPSNTSSSTEEVSYAVDEEVVLCVAQALRALHVLALG